MRTLKKYNYPIAELKLGNTLKHIFNIKIYNIRH